jgi:tetratricopeptide (TPR) repeat protein
MYVIARRHARHDKPRLAFCFFPNSKSEGELRSQLTRWLTASAISILVSCIVAIPVLAGQATQSTVDELISKGDAFYKQGKYREAIESFKLAVGRDPNNDQAIGYIGYAYHRLNEKASAREWMKRRADLPGQSTPLKARILADVAFLNWDEADMEIKSRLGGNSNENRLKPDQLAAIQRLVLDGIDSAEKARLNAPGSTRALNLLNLLYRAQAALDPARQKTLIAKADEAIRAAVSIAQDRPPAQGGDLFDIPTVSVSDGVSTGPGVVLGDVIAVARAETANEPGAFAAVEVFIGVDGKVKLPRLVQGGGRFGQAAVNSALRYQFEPTTLEGKPIQVIRVLTFPDKRLAVAPDASSPANRDVLPDQVVDLVEKGDALVGAKRFDEAVAAYQSAIAKAGRPVFTILLNIGNAYFQKEDYAAAADAYRKAIENSPNDRRGHFNRAESLFALRDFAGAEAEYRRVIALSTRPDAKVHQYLGSALFQQKRVEEAIEQYRIALALPRGNEPDVHYNLGVALLAREDYPAAEQAFRSAIDLRRKDTPDGHFNLAITLEKQGRAAEAIDEYETYLRLAPDAPDAEKVRTIVAYLKKHKKP